ncbi:hypothetical protein ACFPRL_27675 [Pseudoclavibacter helvolus]
MPLSVRTNDLDELSQPLIRLPFGLVVLLNLRLGRRRNPLRVLRHEVRHGRLHRRGSTSSVIRVDLLAGRRQQVAHLRLRLVGHETVRHDVGRLDRVHLSAHRKRLSAQHDNSRLSRGRRRRGKRLFANRSEGSDRDRNHDHNDDQGHRGHEPAQPGRCRRGAEAGKGTTEHKARVRRAGAVEHLVARREDSVRHIDR